MSVYTMYFLRSRPNQEVFYTIRMKELGVRKCVRIVPCLCSKYHFSEGELLSGTSYSTTSIFYTSLPHLVTTVLCPTVPVILSLLLIFFRWFSKRNTWAFLSAKVKGLATRFLSFKNEPSFNFLTNVLRKK